MNRTTYVGVRLDISGIVSHVINRAVRGVRRTIDGNNMQDVTSLKFRNRRNQCKPKQESDEYKGSAVRNAETWG